MSTVRMMLLTLVFSSAVSLVGCKPEEGTRAESSDEAASPSQDPPRQESSPPPGAVALAGTLAFEGRPIHELTSVEPIFSLNNVDTGEKGIRPETEYDKGRFEIRELPPGGYIMFVSIDANPDNPGGFPGYPGDFFLPANAARVSVPDSGVTFNVDLAQVIHLTLPEDNAGVMERWGETGQDMIAFASPVQFTWDAVTDGAQYHYAIHRMQSEPFKAVECDVERSTTGATRVLLSLPPNKEGEFYMLQLHATKGAPSGRRTRDPW